MNPSAPDALDPGQPAEGVTTERGAGTDGIAAPETASPTAPVKPKEFGGRRDGTEPTRFGDWEKGGRCIDF